MEVSNQVRIILRKFLEAIAGIIEDRVTKLGHKKWAKHVSLTNQLRYIRTNFWGKVDVQV
jgi:hypothetical protein